MWLPHTRVERFVWDRSAPLTPLSRTPIPSAHTDAADPRKERRAGATGGVEAMRLRRPKAMWD